ncbi:MAG: type II/IV secretion system protein [Planctomycetota bacterium]|nr:MAG: type II/IV secretion system protein [Planctomycetota bacterium]
MPTPNNLPADGVVNLVNELLGKAISRRASDVHFEPGNHEMKVRYRLDGVLNDVDSLPAALAENMVARLKVLSGLLTYRTDVPQEGSFPADSQWEKDGRSLDIRVATFPTIWGERAVVRLLYSVGTVNELDGLGLPVDLVTDLRRAVEKPHGLLLVTGPAGSGKSTTLYALARYILAKIPGRSVVSLEDPVEQRIEGMTQIQVSPYGELNYIRAMRSLLRQDVQVLLVGEIRDAETAHIVVEASLTGHLVMSTLHSGDPAEAIVRLLEMGIAPYQLAGAISVVCSQRLLRTVCKSCGGKGECEDCSGIGYLGRTACGQIAVMDETLRQAVLARRPVGELRRMLNERGSDLATDAKRLIEQGRTTIDEVMRVLGAA